ncbi:hypothetical protein ES705_28042 [subsurface metagenome]
MSIVTIVAILCITALEIVAVINNINGALLAGSIAIIAGLGGWSASKKLKK